MNLKQESLQQVKNSNLGTTKVIGIQERWIKLHSYQEIDQSASKSCIAILQGAWRALQLWKVLEPNALRQESTISHQSNPCKPDQFAANHLQ
jgi:hypothetical protein